ERLVGLRIERGVLNEIHSRVGGRVGCSHIKELASNVVHFAASYLVGRRAGVEPMSMDFARRSPDERFAMTKELLRDSCLAYCQTTAHGLDERIGIKRVGEEHAHSVPLGTYEASLGVLLKDRAARWADKTYVRYRDGDNVGDMSFGAFAETVERIARHLVDLGIGSGDRLAMISENRPEMFLFEMAVMSIGAVTVPIFAGYGTAQVSYVLRHARPRFVVVSGAHQLEKIERARFPWVRGFYAMDFDAACGDWGAEKFSALTQAGGAPPERVAERVEAVRPDDLCMVMYTSGTTGPPKGVRLNHRNLISQQKAVSLLWDVDEHDVFLSYLPWHHSFGGLFERFITLYNGSELCLDDSRGRNVDRLIANWQVFDPTVFLSVPRVHDQLVARCREDRDVDKLVFGGRLRFVFTAGAPLPADVAEAYRDHGIPVLEGWGLTETSPCVTLTTKEGTWRSGYVGFPIPGTTVRIDGDQEILVKGPNVMEGYLDDEEATAQVIDDEGWFHTGDLGEFSREGLRIFGRKDGTFKLTTGEKVHPQRIENVLVNESRFVHMALVIGSGQDYVGALIYPDMGRLRAWAQDQDIPEDALPDHPTVRALFAAELARLNPMIDVKYQRVRRAVLVHREPSLAQGELTPSGKIVRKAVLSNSQHRIKALFSPDPPEEIIDMARELQRI
ncbi:MAG: AMP-binding protein, partial [Phycisphaerae bacterium]